MPNGSASDRPTLRLSEASEARDRRCADCGKMTSSWKPVRRRGTAILLCSDCAAKPAVEPAETGGCPNCGVAFSEDDTFCGRCGSRVSFTCPACGQAAGAADAFCGKCGARLAKDA